MQRKNYWCLCSSDTSPLALQVHKPKPLSEIYCAVPHCAHCLHYLKSLRRFFINSITISKRVDPEQFPSCVGYVVMITTRITVSSANRSELFQTIVTLPMPVINEKGCLSSRFYLDSADSNSAMLVEEWETEDDWDKHLRSRDCAGVFLGAVSVLCRPSGVDFKLLSYVAGIEAITAARAAQIGGVLDELFVGDKCPPPTIIWDCPSTPTP